MTNVVQLNTRKPTGLPPWPMVLLAGAEKAGKSYAAAAASASEHVDRTLWISVGEDDPDELGALPGARFEIVQHDGTYRDILAALTAAATQPIKAKPHLIVLDSATRLWDLLCDEQQVEANRRAAVKAKRNNQPVADQDATITMDQWNTAKQRWAHCIGALRDHYGPSIITARLEEVTVLDERGNPTKNHTWKVKAEKSLPYDVGAIVEMPQRGKAFLTGVRSLRFQPDPKNPDRTEYPDFTVEKLWTDLGVTEKNGTSARQHSGIDPEDKPLREGDAARADLAALCTANGWDTKAIAAEFAKTNDVEVKVASAGLIREFIATKEAEVAA